MSEDSHLKENERIIPLARREHEPEQEPREGPEAPLGLPDDRILGEISHEVGNYFHKLYYWTDYLKTHSDGRADTAPVEMLEETVGRLERFMRMMLEYLAPAKMSFNRIEAGELVAGLGTKLPGREVRVRSTEDWRHFKVLADPSLMAHALRTVFDRVAGTLIDEDALIVEVDRARRREFQGIEIAFQAGAGINGRERLKKGIEMAVAEKFLLMHGGELFERAEPSRALVIFLPIYD
ncbi:MAG: hypothetical protein D6760_00305 [Deltaproteobacteria bacterium]|nr:MAG: hypothetical protein D6760_00305 [Deltaproteobacteria bacterium]